jgi:hypothetical protein
MSVRLNQRLKKLVRRYEIETEKIPFSSGETVDAKELAKDYSEYICSEELCR